jgi:hypothetical protein
MQFILREEWELELVTEANHVGNVAKIYNIKIPETKAKEICGNNIQTIKTELDGEITEHVSNLNTWGALSPWTIRT